MPKWLLCSLLFIGVPLKAATISIIIDDVGDNERLALRSLYLDPNVALAILPHTPFSRSIAELAQHHGNVVMLHQPMESHTNNHLLGPGQILTNMPRNQIRRTLKDNIKAVPGAIGVNNHMGSKMTENPTQMAWIMSELSQQNLFFIDSRTTAKSVAAETASRWSVPNVTRHVFLDHIDSVEFISGQFDQLVKIAKTYGHAIAIGHPKDNTLTFLEQALSQLDEFDVELLSIADHINFQFYRPIEPREPELSCRILDDIKYHMNTVKQEIINYRCNPIMNNFLSGE